MSAATATPRLIDRKGIAAELGIPLSAAETIMRDCEKTRIGRRVYLTRDELEDYLRRHASR